MPHGLAIKRPAKKNNDFQKCAKKTLCPFPFSPCPRPPWTCSAQQERQKGGKPREKLEKKMWYMSKMAHPWFSRTVVTRPARPAAATTAASPSARRRQRGGSIWSSRPLQNLTAFKRPKKSVQLKKPFFWSGIFYAVQWADRSEAPTDSLFLALSERLLVATLHNHYRLKFFL